MQSTYPIVGARFHPPAEAIIKALPRGVTLAIVPEPENPHDENALAVWVPLEAISANLKELEDDLPGYGLDLGTFVAQSSWQLGYLPKEVALRLKGKTLGNLTLGFDSKGKPTINLTIMETPVEHPF